MQPGPELAHADEDLRDASSAGEAGPLDTPIANDRVAAAERGDDSRRTARLRQLPL